MLRVATIALTFLLRLRLLANDFPPKNVLLQTYYYVCNALYNRRLTLIAIIEFNSGQMEIN